MINYFFICFDLALSIILTILLYPIFVVLSFLVLISSKGSIFFTQKRLGLYGKEFNIFKFRTMYENIPDLRNDDGSTISIENDSRVTRIGNFMRKNSLDELPQLLNVIIGDMSIVGPRPDQVDQLSCYSEEEMTKLLVKPGITGWSQIHGRNKITWDERKKLDCYYVKNQSIKRYFYILLHTIPLVVQRKGIHQKDTTNVGL